MTHSADNSALHPGRYWRDIRQEVKTLAMSMKGRRRSLGEAVKAILTLNGNFVADAELERYSLTFNPNGFLRRAR